MWRVDRTFLFFSGLDLEQVLAELTEIVEREVRIADFSQGMRVSLAFFLFALFHIITLFFTPFSSFSSFFFFSFSFFCTFSLFHFFHIISFFLSYFPFFFAFFFALSLTWPRPQPCRLTLPSLTLPHITSPLLSFLNTILKKRSIEIFSRFLC